MLPVHVWPALPPQAPFLLGLDDVLGYGTEPDVALLELVEEAVLVEEMLELALLNELEAVL